MMYTMVRGRHGDEFAYYVCGNRHHGEAGCTLPYVPAHDVESRIERGWPLWVRMDQLDVEAVAAALWAEIGKGGQNREETLRRAARQLKALDDQRRKLIQMVYAEAIPLDLLKAGQDRIGRERLVAERDMAQAQTHSYDIEQTYRQAVAVIRLGAAIYRQVGPEARRKLNRAFLVRIEIDADETQADLGEPWEALTAAAAHVRTAQTAGVRPELATVGAGGATWGHSRTNPDHDFHDRGSSMNPLVELRGFEPLTLTLPV